MPSIAIVGASLAGLSSASALRRLGFDGRLVIVGEEAVFYLGDGARLQADVVLVGIGVIPNTEWLEGSGLALRDGVVCDETCLAAPGIGAAGDVARWPNLRYGTTRREENRDNAVRQAEHVAKRLLARPGDPAETAAYSPVSRFWSDQYDFKLQFAGSADGYDEVEVVSGCPLERKFVASYRRAGRLVAVLALNSAGKMLKAIRELESSAFSRNPAYG